MKSRHILLHLVLFASAVASASDAVTWPVPQDACFRWFKMNGHPAGSVAWRRRIAGGDGKYIGWPTATRLKSGEIAVVFSGDRFDHVCPWGKVQIVKSSDQGETWTKPRTLVNDLIDDRDAGLLELPSGRQALFYFTSLAFAEKTYANYAKGHPDWSEHLQKLGAAAERLKGSWVRLSDDGGKTWGEPISTLVQTPHGGIRLRDGRIFMLGRRLDKPQRYFAVESRDDGKTWSVVSEVPMNAVEAHWSLSEPSLFEGRDGTLHGYFRYELGNRHMLYVRSTDGGKTWTKPVSSVINGFPPHFLRLCDGRVVCSYGCRTDGRIGIFARISSDDGASWGDEIQLDSQANRDLGYASTVELDDGSLLTVYYMHYQGETKASLVATKWSCASDSAAEQVRGEKASFSPDGKRLVFERLENHRHRVGVVEIGSREITWISDGAGEACQPAWAPDGSVVFTAGHLTNTAFVAMKDKLGYNLWRWKDGALKRLTSGRLREYCASVAPDGCVYFVSEGIKPDNGATDVYAGNRTGIGRIGPDGGAVERVTVMPKANTGIIDPAVSPDGTRLLRAEVSGYRTPWRLVVSPLARPDEKTHLTGEDMVAHAPAWSPDGSTIAFCGCRRGDDGWYVYLMSATGGEMRRFAKGRNPSFSPDGRRLVFDQDGRLVIREVMK